MRLLPLLAVVLMVSPASGQRFVANYDESKIPDYQLPDPLTTEAGDAVVDADAWHQSRRPEILKLFQDHVYGNSPDAVAVEHRVVSEAAGVINGLADRREIDLTIKGPDREQTIGLLIYTPTGASEPVPCFLGLNFQGNHSVDPDPAIRIPTSWVRDRNNETTDGHRATEAGRGVASDRWPVEMIVKRGYGLVTIYYGDIDPDFDDQFENGIHGAFASWHAVADEETRWGSIAGWAYGLSRTLDYLESDPAIDGDRVAVFGHSRLGKTSLWAGASDPRFALVISNDSGCGGAALSRRAYGETVGRINQSFPHWFNDKFNDYSRNESELPVDQHQLLSLIAPRPVYVASAVDDRWADPKGEFLACYHADPVYRLLGTKGLGGSAPQEKQPAPNQPIADGHIGYHVRTGKHDVTDFDWQQYLDFADKHL